MKEEKYRKEVKYQKASDQKRGPYQKDFAKKDAGRKNFAQKDANKRDSYKKDSYNKAPYKKPERSLDTADNGNDDADVESALRLEGRNAVLEALNHDKPIDKILVKKGEILFSYETDKASFECESTEDGTLLEIFFGDGDEVPVLTNVCAVGEDTWSVGVQDPQNAGGLTILDTLHINSGSVVTSGSYQRFYTVNGKSYNHIIDPETLMPAERYAAVTVIADDAAVADMLSTALFILPKEQGEALLKKHAAEAIWIAPGGAI